MAPSDAAGDTRWIDVSRLLHAAMSCHELTVLVGTAWCSLFLVVNAHIARSLAPYLLSPHAEDGSSLLWQRPIVRNMFMGRASIAVFAIVSGYVNGLKATRLTREGQTDVALAAISKTAFRRTFRFILPMVVATCITWTLCQLGLFKLGEIVEWGWIRDTSPPQSDDMVAAVQDLFFSLGRTWVNGANAYDPVQWTLCYLLKGSMLVYTTLFATAFVQPKHRYGVYMLMYGYYWWMRDAVIGTNIYTGLILAELSNDPRASAYMARPNVSLICASLAAIFTGLFCISYPEMNPEKANWSNNLLHVGLRIFPTDAEFDRFWPAVGSQLIVTGLFFVPQLKYMLSWPPLAWMGKVSFAIYLIHGTMMRSLLTYMVFGRSAVPEAQFNPETGLAFRTEWVPEYSKLTTGVAILLFYPLLYKTAGLWVRWVDPMCSRLASWAESWMFIEGENEEKSVRLALPA